MSTIKCPDCGRTVSTDAASCPHCGCPSSSIKSKSSFRSCIGFIICIALIILAYVSRKDEDKTQHAETERHKSEIVTSGANEAPKVQPMYDTEYENPSYSPDKVTISDDEIIESPEYEPEETLESNVNDVIEDNIDVAEY